MYSIQLYVIKYLVCQWLATGQWFSVGILVSSTNKTDCHDITEILLKVALRTINLETWKPTLVLAMSTYVVVANCKLINKLRIKDHVLHISHVVTSARPCNKVGHLFWFTILAQHETDDVILYIHSVHKHRGNSFKLQNYKMRLKQIRLNWINSMQVIKILFTNVFFSWSLCLLNMF